MNFRIGHGYDVHKLVSERPLILGGIPIPHETGLLGHSDADVVIHALMDAILGALALGDIGKWFPDQDETFKDADSMQLLRQVMQHIHTLGWKIGNVDLTIIAQAPKLSSYIMDMRNNIADAMKTDLSNISIKATTEEGLGFTGNKQGIATHAVCLLSQS